MTDEQQQTPDADATDFAEFFGGVTDKDQVDLDLWFTYHPPTPQQIPIYEAIRDAGYQMAEKILAIVPPSPDRTVAIRHVREAVMNANAALACYPDGMPPR